MVTYLLLIMGNESSYERYYAITATDEDYTGDQDPSSPSPYLVSSLEVDFFFILCQLKPMYSN